MNTYLRWGARAGVPVLVLLATWIFRAELTAWFALESDSTAMAMTDMATDGGGGAGSAPTSQPASQPVAQPASQPANQSAGQPTSQPTSQPSSQPTSQPMAAGPGFIRLTPYQRQLIGVTTARVDRRPLQATLRTVGHVDYDEDPVGGREHQGPRLDRAAPRGLHGWRRRAGPASVHALQSRTGVHAAGAPAGAGHATIDAGAGRG